ncbi:MAG: GDP-mannose pyrophosphatase NudK [Bacteroidota bacterium]
MQSSNRVKNLRKELLSNNWYTLDKVTYDFKLNNGDWQTQTREAYDRGNGATILLYNKEKKTVILTRQFRLPTYLNGNESGFLIEACAGLLDKDNPEDCIKKEAEEETGYRLDKVEKVFESYMSPGSVTEILYFFIAEYSEDMKVGKGGGLETEQEHIEVIELPFDRAFDMIKSGEIRDGKTIMLLQYLKIQNVLA